MKILNSSTASPFGGYNFVIDELDRKRIDSLLEYELPLLSPQCTYNWKDLLYSFWGIYFCGGDCIEDLSYNLKGSYGDSPVVKTPSPDRVLDRFKELTVPISKFKTPRGGNITHDFGINTKLNDLNLKILNRLGCFKSKKMVLDYDNTILYNKKKDATMTYKKDFGYCPGVGIIGNNIVYVENRNGNSAAANLQEDTLERMFSLLGQHNIKIDKFRADGASYKYSILPIINENTNNFYIRANMNAALTKAINKIENWREVKIEGEVAFRGDVEFTPFVRTAKRNKEEYLLKTYRLVVTKIRRSDGQFNVFTGEPYNYHAVLTNDYKMTNDQIVFFYNQRGTEEKEFDILKNDFGWDKMPFSKLEQNTVFLIMTAICRNIYSYIIELFSSKFNGLGPEYRIKKFIFRFICIPAKWVRSGRTKKLRIYGQIAYKT